MVITPHIEKFYSDTLSNGGATVDLTKHSLPQPQGRYFVGAGRNAWVHIVKVEDFTPQYLASLVLIAKREKFNALGTWVDEGLVYVEPTFTFNTEDAARSVSETLGEKAYYDVEAGKSVYL